MRFTDVATAIARSILMKNTNIGVSGVKPTTSGALYQARLFVVNKLRHRGVILSMLGRYKNTLKIRPPMPFSIENADLMLDTLDEVLSETPLTT